MLSPGDRFGPYEVVSPLGAGGMGEVYRARDTRLEREVALKVLPDEVAHDPGRLKRFEREAKATAALSHPNVLTVFDVGTENGRSYVVTEVLDGATLAARLRRGPLPVKEALSLAAQAARGLAAAHAKGIVHRDVKPENLFLTTSGAVKILDFGLAHSVTGYAGENTTESNPTGPGSVVGTVSYMSPEQAKGLPLDARSDIFSLGVVLHEMLSGRHPFKRTTSAETISAILRDEPADLGAPGVVAPGAVEEIVKRCLDKRSEGRFQTADDLALTLEVLARGESGASGLRPSTAPRRWVGARAWLLYVVAALLLGGGIVALRSLGRPASHTPESVRFSFDIEDDGITFDEIVASRGLERPALMAVCPDGACIAYRGNRGSAQLFLRRFDQLESLALPGTTGGYAPFFANDGRTIGFFADGRLKTISVEGLVVRVVAEATDGWSGCFGPRGELFYSTRLSPITRIPAGGGAPQVVTRLAPGEISHRWPTLLPGGRALLFETVDAARESHIVAQSLETGRRTLIFDGGAVPRLVAGLYLVFVRVGRETLAGAQLDVAELRLLGQPVELFEQPMGSTLPTPTFARSSGFHDVSTTGTLAYVDLAGANRSDLMLWRVDRSGRGAAITDLKRGFAYPRFAPDGQHIAVTISDQDGQAVWLYDVARRSLTRLTFEGRCLRAIWTPDGRRLTYQSDRAGPMNLYSEPYDGAGPVVRHTVNASFQWPGSWSPDGRTLTLGQRDQPEGRTDIWILKPDQQPERAFETYEVHPLGPKWDGFFSPDGRLVTYTSLESGRLEVYVRRYGGPEKRQVSIDGGNAPVWSRSGSELFYTKGRQLMVAAIRDSPELSVGEPRLLFEGDYASAGTVSNYDVAPDDQSFVMIRGEHSRPFRRITVVLNWSEELKRRLPIP